MVSTPLISIGAYAPCPGRAELKPKPVRKADLGVESPPRPQLP